MGQHVERDAKRYPVEHMELLAIRRDLWEFRCSSATIPGITPGQVYNGNVINGNVDVDEFNGSLSQLTSQFVIQSTVPAPTLVGPGSTTPSGPYATTPTTFQWDQVPNATSYLLQEKDITAGTGINNLANLGRLHDLLYVYT